MRDAILLQYASGELHFQMIAVTRPRHQLYAERHGCDYRCRDTLEPLTADFGWVRWEMLLDAFVAGYETAVYLESDTCVHDLSVDFRSAVPPGRPPLAMKYNRVPGGEPWHYQTGMIIARNDPAAIAFCEAVMREKPSPSPGEETCAWWERERCQQVIANRLLAGNEWSAIVTKLDERGNSIEPMDGMIVRAWHGRGPERHKLDEMRTYIEGAI